MDVANGKYNEKIVNKYIFNLKNIGINDRVLTCLQNALIKDSNRLFNIYATLILIDLKNNLTMKHCLSLLLLILFCQNGYSQQSTIDSIITIAKNINQPVAIV